MRTRSLITRPDICFLFLLCCFSFFPPKEMILGQLYLIWQIYSCFIGKVCRPNHVYGRCLSLAVISFRKKKVFLRHNHTCDYVVRNQMLFAITSHVHLLKWPTLFKSKFRLNALLYNKGFKVFHTAKLTQYSRPTILLFDFIETDFIINLLVLYKLIFTSSLKTKRKDQHVKRNIINVNDNIQKW